MNYTMIIAVGHKAMAATALAFCFASAHGQEFEVPIDLQSGVTAQLEPTGPQGTSLILESTEVPFRFLNVGTLAGAPDGTGTLVRVNTETGEVIGEYRSAPLGLATNPSRTSIDSYGNVWVGNRDIERIDEIGSVVKIGLVVGGKRCDEDGINDPNGAYLRPPFLYSTAIDRDGDGLIRTSLGLGDVLDWNAVTDSDGGDTAYVEDAIDECILIYQRVPGPLLRHISVDGTGDVWVGDTPENTSKLVKLSGESGAILTEIEGLGCVGIGGLVDSSGVVWSANNTSQKLMRFDPTNQANTLCIPIPSTHGLSLDNQGFIWNSQHSARAVSKIAPDGTVVFQNKPVAGASVLRGMVNTQEGHVWIADSTQDVVFRLDNSGDAVGSPIPVGIRPTTVSVDGHGDVWVACKDSDELQRINPLLGNSGAVDLTVPLTPGSAPQGYGEMTGNIAMNWAVQRGYFTGRYDSGSDGTLWISSDWVADMPMGSSIRATLRSADTEEELVLTESIPVISGEEFSALGRFVEVQLKLISSQNSHLSPILHSLTVSGELAGIACEEPNRRTPGSLLLFPVYRSGNGQLSVLTVTNTASTEIDVEYVYINKVNCSEFNRTETLTANDTLTLLSAGHNPAQSEEGFLYVFAKQGNQAATHNDLIGQELLLNGYLSIDYSINAVAFEGIGENGLTDIDSDGTRDLDGLEYSMAPDALLIPRFFGQADEISQLEFQSRLILISLAGGPEFSTIVDLLIYNDNEQVFSAEHEFTCWANPTLIELSNAFSGNFLRNSTNHAPDEIIGAPTVETGWFRIDGSSASSSATSIQDPAIYAVLIDFLAGRASADLPFEMCSQEGGGLMHSGLHGDD
ncbi:MAG: hypothetical protein ACI8X5_000256 [Planctomycetota bacterium]|jgi:hypothetical protein